MEQAKQQSPLEALVEDYLRLRTKKEDLVAAHTLELDALNVEFDAVSNEILAVCNSLGADTLKTSAGTVTRKIRERYWTSNWPSMYQCIKEYDAPFLLEQRIHNGNMKQFLQDNPDVLPPGLNVNSQFVIQVRKPNAT